MYLSENKIRLTIFCLLMLLPAYNSLSFKKEENIKQSNNILATKLPDSIGYTGIAYFRDKFIAIGTNGRIDRISKSGERFSIDSSSNFRLNGVYSNEEILISVGNHGTILYSKDGDHFHKIESGTDKNIYGIAFKNGLLMAGSENGEILSSKDGLVWKSLPSGAKGSILSLSANNSFFIGITDKGEILKSTDGTNWEIKDYNKEYAGYNKYSKFKKVLATQNSIVIIGTHDDGSPSILFSSLGNVWAERLPVYHDDEEIIQYLAQAPNGIAYDPDRDQYILACDNGGLFILPGCTKCNKLLKISDKILNTLLYIDDNLYIVGEKFSVYVQKL